MHTIETPLTDQSMIQRGGGGGGGGGEGGVNMNNKYEFLFKQHMAGKLISVLSYP